MVIERICSEDGTVMSRSIRPKTYIYKELSIDVNMPGWYCSECKESIHEGEDLKVYGRAIHLLKAQYEGLLKPQEIRRIRKKLNLSQTAAGMILGGGARAFQKYESGDLLPSKAISNLLSTLDDFPEALRKLKDNLNTKLQLNKNTHSPIV